MLSACANASVPAAVEAAPDYCRDYQPVYTPPELGADYPEADRVIQGNNAAWLCVCEQDCPEAGE